MVLRNTGPGTVLGTRSTLGEAMAECRVGPFVCSGSRGFREEWYRYETSEHWLMWMNGRQACQTHFKSAIFDGDVYLEV